MRTSVKRLVCITMILALFCSVLSIQEMDGEASSTYKLTKYKSYNQVVKKLPKDDSSYLIGVTYAKSKMKTKFGTKKVLVCRTNGFDPSASITKLFVSNGKKIYMFQKLNMGYVKSQSKDGRVLL